MGYQIIILQQQKHKLLWREICSTVKLIIYQFSLFEGKPELLLHTCSRASSSTSFCSLFILIYQLQYVPCKVSTSCFKSAISVNDWLVISSHYTGVRFSDIAAMICKNFHIHQLYIIYNDVCDTPWSHAFHSCSSPFCCWFWQIDLSVDWLPLKNS